MCFRVTEQLCFMKPNKSLLHQLLQGINNRQPSCGVDILLFNCKLKNINHLKHRATVTSNQYNNCAQAVGRHTVLSFLHTKNISITRAISKSYNTWADDGILASFVLYDCFSLFPLNTKGKLCDLKVVSSSFCAGEFLLIRKSLVYGKRVSGHRQLPETDFAAWVWAVLLNWFQAERCEDFKFFSLNAVMKKGLRELRSPTCLNGYLLACKKKGLKTNSQAFALISWVTQGLVVLHWLHQGLVLSSLAHWMCLIAWREGCSPGRRDSSRGHFAGVLREALTLIQNKGSKDADAPGFTAHWCLLKREKISAFPITTPRHLSALSSLETVNKPLTDKAGKRLKSSC